MIPQPPDTVFLTSPPAELRHGQTELWQRYRVSGPGDSSEEELVKAYLPLVKTVVGRLAMTLPSHVGVEDLYSVGLIGLLNAVRQFNPAIGAPFESYARLRIRGAVLDELRRTDWATRYVHAKARKMQAAMSTLEQTLGRLPTDVEVAGALNLPPGEYERWLDEIRPATFISLDVAAKAEGQDDDIELEALQQEALLVTGDQEAPSARVSGRDLSRLISERIGQLPDLQQKILAMHYFEDMRLKEIALALGYCEAHICQSHAKAILAIRACIEQAEARAGRKLDSAA